MDDGGQVTLVFYQIDPAKWHKEPWLNLVAAAAQWSRFTHVELAIGTDATASGAMTNVVRVFNDNVGVEVTARTGRNPQYSYKQIGCSKRQEAAMLAYARTLIGRPFSNTGMARSLFWPRKTTGDSFFCAELVAAVLQKGGLIDPASNAGCATPTSLHSLFKSRATTTGNPFLLRQANAAQTISTQSIVPQRIYSPPPLAAPRNGSGAGGAAGARMAIPPMRCAEVAPTSGAVRGTAGLRVLAPGVGRAPPAAPPIGLTLNSLNFRR